MPTSQDGGAVESAETLHAGPDPGVQALETVGSFPALCLGKYFGWSGREVVKDAD